MATPAGPWTKYASQTPTPAGPWEKYARPETGERVQSMSSTSTSDQPKPGLIERGQNYFDKLTAHQPYTPIHSIADAGKNIATAASNFGAGLFEPLTPLVHPAKAIDAALTPQKPQVTPGSLAIDALGPAGPLISDTVKRFGKGEGAEALGNLGTMAIGGEGGGEAMDLIPEGGSAVRSAAIGDPNAAALRGLRVPSGSPRTIRTIGAVEGSRPFLQGAQSLEDLQTRVPQAKTEIWGPYKKTIDAIGDQQVRGPDGPTTVAELEKQRVQLSALNRQLKQRNPEAIRLAEQKGLTQAQLLDQERAVQNALDPVLTKAGIQPQAIRKAFGQVSEIGERVSGKSTLTEEPQRYGVGKMVNLDFQHPLNNLSNIGAGFRDIFAGRPLWSGKPTDIALREGFRPVQPKPDFGQLRPSTPPRIAGFLNHGAIPMGPGEIPEADISAPPRTEATTRAQRLGLLLPKPPIELSGAVEAAPPAYSPTTRASRLGLLLPEKAGGKVTLPYYPEMTPGEHTAALMNYLRQRPQPALPARTRPIQLPAGRAMRTALIADIGDPAKQESGDKNNDA